MAVRRIVPNIHSDRAADNRAFYADLLGLDVAMDQGWITTFASPTNPTAQLSVISQDATAPVHADLSVEVDDVDAAHDQARRQRVEIVYPLTDEPWGVRRFFVRDPNGLVVNIVGHR